MIWTMAIAAGDLADRLQQLQVNKNDTIIIKLEMDPNEPFLTQEVVDNIAEVFGRVLGDVVTEGNFIVIPLPKSTDIEVSVLDERTKENLRRDMKRLGVIE